jgi:hypothetical protein
LSVDKTVGDFEICKNFLSQPNSGFNIHLLYWLGAGVGWPRPAAAAAAAAAVAAVGQLL